MIIGVDIDDVLADLGQFLVSFHNDTYGTSLTRDDHTDYSLYRIWDVTPEEAIKRVREFFESACFDDVTPMEGAVEGVSRLKAGGHEMVVITSRPSYISGKTMAWIEKYFPDCFNGVYFAGHYVTKDNVKKTSFCTGLGVDVMLEDCLQIALELATAKISVFLLDAPWNQSGGLPAEITRVYSWKEMVALIG